MARIKLHQKKWEQSKVLFEKFILVGNGSVENIETAKTIRSVYAIGKVSVSVSWRKNYRDTPASNRKVCGRLLKKVDFIIAVTKKKMDSGMRPKFLHAADELKTHLADMWSSTEYGTGVIPMPIHFRHG
jgi:hypothetical protein